jgi:hypothetical protein
LVWLLFRGAIKTDFYDRSMDIFRKEGLPAYDRYEQVVSEQKLAVS